MQTVWIDKRVTHKTFFYKNSIEAKSLRFFFSFFVLVCSHPRMETWVKAKNRIILSNKRRDTQDILNFIRSDVGKNRRKLCFIYASGSLRLSFYLLLLETTKKKRKTLLNLLDFFYSIEEKNIKVANISYFQLKPPWTCAGEHTEMFMNKINVRVLLKIKKKNQKWKEE